ANVVRRALFSLAPRRFTLQKLLKERTMLRRLFVLLIVLAPAPPFAADGWISLFDGKSLDGWTIKGGKAEYKVEDGMIVGTTVERSPNTFLCKGPYGDFELEFDVLCDKPLNSGVQIR